MGFTVKERRIFRKLPANVLANFQQNFPKNLSALFLQSLIGCTPKVRYGNTAFWEGFWEGSGKRSGEGFSEGFWEGGLFLCSTSGRATTTTTTTTTTQNGNWCNSGKKKSTKINFLGAETAWWGGGLPLEGVVAENFVPALESSSSLGFEERKTGMSQEFCRDVPPWWCSKS